MRQKSAPSENANLKVPHIPENLPLKQIDWASLVSLIARANAALARYDGRLEGILNPQLLLSPLMTREAVLSSKIEGTQATLEEVLNFEADPSEPRERVEDIEEIMNYRRALSHAESQLDKRPVSLNLIKEMHGILLERVRGQHKMRGDFRHSQNWIGPPNSPIEAATYIPPPPNRIINFLSNWEKYYHSEEKDGLVQLAILHGQFELIHPFLDGNGRIGRLLIPLFLYEKGILTRPMFYISAYIDATRDDYYAKLLSLSSNGDWGSWIRYFLGAIIEQAGENSKKIQEIMKLYDSMKQDIVDLTHSQFAMQTLDFLFNRPIFSGPMFTKGSQVPKPSAARLLKCLEQGGIIRSIRQPRGRRPGVYSFRELLNIIAT